MNRLTIIVNLGTAPEMRYTQTDKTVTNFSVAVIERWNDSAGERRERTPDSASRPGTGWLRSARTTSTRAAASWSRAACRATAGRDRTDKPAPTSR